MGCLCFTYTDNIFYCLSGLLSKFLYKCFASKVHYCHRFCFRKRINAAAVRVGAQSCYPETVGLNPGYFRKGT